MKKIVTSSVSLKRDKSTGWYYSPDGNFEVQQGTVGWNVYRREIWKTGDVFWEYENSYETLRDVRASLPYLMEQWEKEFGGRVANEESNQV